MTPIEHYQQDLKQKGFLYDVAQEAAAHHLQRLYDDLLVTSCKTKRLKEMLCFWSTPRQPSKGIFFWGGVGRGKTWLVDTFYDSLPFEDKMRTHFHRFMRWVHEELDALKGQKDPLVIVARHLARDVRIICFDEFFVSDIADAMILAGLLDELFKNGVTLVATSNVAPDDLYKDGLQRDKFLPAIALLKQHLDVLNIDSGVDYRLRLLEQARFYHFPQGYRATAAMESNFMGLISDNLHIREHFSLVVERRPIPCLKACDGVIWFSFEALCNGPRSQNDYIELAKEFHTVLISGVPRMRRETDDQVRRFIMLVDEFYDRSVKLIMSGEASLPELYTDGALTFEFQRTLSRLQEMQSLEYLGREHKP